MPTPPKPAPPPAPPASKPQEASAPAAASCSASRLSPIPKPTAKPLPPAVASMRERIIKAAVACDYAALQKLGDEKGKGVRFSYDPDQDMATTWRIQEEWTESPQPVLARLVHVLNLPFYQEGDLYWWPTAFRKDATDGDFALLNGIYPEEMIADMRKEKSYIGMRVGISADGDWQAAIQGD
ncbi:hypothetical protein [Corallococcus sp. EGB]|uniref:hypothetical protein n=1 Tax=Corallococcus sp. EGB TaxID=1521117 RepID=UPI001CBBDF39|nr:hypothetical protein [Corallococcus sp. EGB]